MGGMVSILARLSDNRKVSFRISTGNLSKFDDVSLFDESNFMNFIEKNKFYIEDAVADYEQEDYYNSRCFFAPFDYGLLFFDFKKKTIWSSNNYSGFICLNSWLIKSQYENLSDWVKRSGKKVDELKSATYAFKNGKQVLESETGILESYSQMFSALFHISQVLNAGGSFIFKDTPLPSDLKDVYSILSHVYGKDLISSESLKEEREYKRLSVKVDDCSDFLPYFPDWTIHQGDGSYESVNPIYNYLLLENIMKDNDIKYWKIYLNEKKSLSENEN